MLTRAEFDQLLNAIGTNVTWHQAKAGTDTTVKAVVASASKRDEAIVNAYGIGAVMFQVDAALCQPEKLDRFTVGTERYTISDVSPRHERGTGNVISFTCYCRGR